MSATITRSMDGVAPDTARAFENVAREVLAGSSETCEVQFGTWPAQDGRLQVVCRVETPPAIPFGAELQWRWWSPLLDHPEQLREALSAALRARGERLGVSAPTRPSSPAAV